MMHIKYFLTTKDYANVIITIWNKGWTKSLILESRYKEKPMYPQEKPMYPQGMSF